MRIIFVSILLSGIVSQQELPTHPSDPYQAQIFMLQQELAKSEATVLKLQIDLASCTATVQDREHKIESLQYSDRAIKLVEKYKILFGGDWIWDSTSNLPVPMKQEQKK